jgi:hypothetical protein
MGKSTVRCLTAACALVVAGAAFGEATFYEREDFRGRSFTVVDPVANFARYGFNDRASSVAVRSGSYMVCDDAGFRGHCATLPPGDYRSLRSMGLNNQISSARPVHARLAPRAVLFTQPNLHGRSFAVEGNQAFRNLAGSGFDNVVSSLRVERGTWMFCSGPDYTGYCGTFEPGDYMHLPRGLNNRISSGRLVDVRDDRDRDADNRSRPRRIPGREGD